MASRNSKRKYNVAQALNKILADNSDDDSFEENDIDRDSCNGVSDHEKEDDNRHADMVADTCADNTGPSDQGCTGISNLAASEFSDGDVEPDEYDFSTVNTLVDSDCWEEVRPDYMPPPGFMFTGDTGITNACGLTPSTIPMDILNKFITPQIIDSMTVETNRYAEQFKSSNVLKKYSKVQRWSETDSTEMKKFLGLVFLMGMVKKPSIEDYWSTDPILATPAVNDVMPRDRFELLLKFWHFSDNSQAVDGDRLHKLKSICDSLLTAFQGVYYPSKQISIDEAMVLWRGRLVFRQYIPGKKHKYGVKLYLLCEPSGYVWNGLIYCGKSDVISGLGHSEAVVMKLMDKLLDKGHELYVDNFYTGIPLARELLKRKTNICGTLRRNRKHLPSAVVSAKLGKGHCISRRKGPIVVSKWRDNREVIMLSTFHTGRLMASRKSNRRGEKIQKPDAVLDYNMSMCGVDRTDQLTSYYSPLRKSLRWYKKVVLHFLDMAMTNAYVLYKKLGGNRQQEWFRIQVIRDLLMSDERPMELSRGQPFLHHKSSDLSRLSGQHFICEIPSAPGRTKTMRKCVVCSKNGQRKESRYLCDTCMSRPALCVTPCFKVYHTLDKY